MIKGIGIDIVEIERVKEAVDKYGRAFLNKIFTARELKYCRRNRAFKYPELAVRFAAKEAYSKAIGTGIAGFGRQRNGLNWKSVEIIKSASGKPFLAINKKIDRRAQVSLSHSRAYAVASVYVEK
jgi:holo-[acyl-carrier protein] synthase